MSEVAAGEERSLELPMAREVTLPRSMVSIL